MVDLIYRVAMGSRRRRALLTPLGLVVFGTSLLIVVGAGLLMDGVLQMAPLLPGVVGTALGVILFFVGATLCGWCVLRFRMAAGTPVPFNPPHELVVEGPYRWSRNPMLTGVFTGLFGLGFLLHSTGMVLMTVPAYILLHVIELKWVEEPELERRFGASYVEYKRQVPMFWPWFWRRMKRRAG
ncbi:MAG: isoprenylcysteine carboxylmethyltransferase family protein [Acidobacteriota bacterium]|nr:MAG: isoprenylcysteine carboxylmethyltransferase family protein [Acidobacteriota bacterium]